MDVGDENSNSTQTNEFESQFAFTQNERNSYGSRDTESDKPTSPIPLSQKHSSQVIQISSETPRTAQKTLPNLNLEEAKKAFSKALENYAIAQTYHGSELSEDFSSELINQLKPSLSQQSEHTQTTFFNALDTLRYDLNLGITADLQFDLLNRVINEDIFWSSLPHEQSIAKTMGIHPPVHTIDKLGSGAPYYIADDAQRKATLDGINQAVVVYKSHIESCLVEQANNEATLHYTTFCESYKHRFINEHHVNWVDEFKTHLMLENHEKYPLGTDLDHIWNYEVTWIQTTFDELADMLILFAVKHAIFTQRNFLKALFIKNKCAWMSIKLKHFNTFCKITKEEVFQQKQIPKKAVTIQDGTSETTSSASTCVQIYCSHDKVGCTSLTCSFKHVRSYEVHCRRRDCPGREGGCNLYHKPIHPSPVNHPKDVKKQRLSQNQNHNKVCQPVNELHPFIGNTLLRTDKAKEHRVANRTEPRRRRKHRFDKADTSISLLRKLCKDITNTGVHVLHNCSLSEEERLVLSLGLNFVPPPKLNKKTVLQEAVDRFSRAVRIKKHFAVLPDCASLDNSVDLCCTYV
jgi:hypothetical protein